MQTGGANATDRTARRLIFLCWLVYALSYLGKVNYSANITQIVDFYGVTKAEAGLVPTFFFFAYGAGQILNGVFCKKYKIKIMVFCSLLASGLLNLAVGLTPYFAPVKWLWLANGALLSVLWPTLIRLLSEKLPAKYLGRSSMAMGTTVATGTLIIYALSALYAAYGNFKLAFYTAAAAEIAVAFVWLFAFDRAAGRGTPGAGPDAPTAANQEGSFSPTDRRAVLATFFVLCICAVGVNLIKDGLETWAPSIFKEIGALPDDLSILLSLFLPIVSIFGNAFALLAHKVVPDYVRHCLLAFAVIGVLLIFLNGILPLRWLPLMLALLVTIRLLASSLNSLVTSIFPMFMRGRVDSGRAAGLLDGFCYIGSTLSAYGLGALADRAGWNAVFWCMLGACALLCAICLLHALTSAVQKARSSAENK